jgi:adenylate cyclase
MVFTDIKDFTSLAESLGAQETVSLLNDYFTEMVEVVFTHHGILDKYIGDGIMAVFGAPFSSPEDADNAVGMAIDMRRVLKLFNKKRIASMRMPIEVRIGISSDHVIAGNIGSDRRMDYTVIGDGVNLAARLESANKQLGTQLLVSGMTVNLLQRKYHMREMDLLRVKGKSAPVPIYEILGNADEKLSERTRRVLSWFAKGLSAYRRRDWVGASDFFNAAMDINPNDMPSRIFFDRAQSYLAAPPADDWDGVWTLYEK